jgi:uncharacterized membrane protein YfcA
MTVAVAFAVAVLASSAPAKANKSFQGAVVIAAAIYMARDCKGISLRGHTDEDAFIQWAATELKAAGLRRNGVLRNVFYAKTAALQAGVNDMLAGVGTSLDDKKGLCRHARKVAGQQDAIGYFLEKR